jgi:hypothetical protein
VSHFRLSSAFSWFVGAVAGLSALWFSRSYGMNAFGEAWGDPNFYRNLSFFWWGTIVSLIVLLSIIILAGLHSRRFRLSVIGSCLFCTSLWLISTVADRHIARITSIPLLPGIFVLLLSCGVHSGIGKWVGALWVLSIDTVLYSVIMAALFPYWIGNHNKELEAKS